MLGFVACAEMFYQVCFYRKRSNRLNCIFKHDYLVDFGASASVSWKLLCLNVTLIQCRSFPQQFTGLINQKKCLAQEHNENHSDRQQTPSPTPCRPPIHTVYCEINRHGISVDICGEVVRYILPRQTMWSHILASFSVFPCTVFEPLLDPCPDK